MEDDWLNSFDMGFEMVADSYEAPITQDYSFLQPQSQSGGYGGMDAYTAGAAPMPMYNNVPSNSGGIDQYGRTQDQVGSGDGFISKFLKYFDKSEAAKGAAVTVAGSFLQGLFSHGDKQKAAKLDERRTTAMERNADSNALAAQSNADMQSKKFANASAIGQTNFGAKNPKGLIYQNRRKIAPLTQGT